MPKIVIDASRTIADLVRRHEETRQVLVRHGLAHRELAPMSLTEAAERRGLDPATLARELREAIIESAPFEVGGFEWDPKKDVVNISTSLASMLELSELTGTPNAFLARVHPDDRERVRGLFRDARALPGTFTFEYRVVHSDGTTRIYASRVEPIDDGRRFIGTSWDITEQHLRDAESGPLLRNTLEATADGILVIDRSGNITTYNQRFLTLWNIPSELAAAGSDEALLHYVLDQLDEPSTFLDEVHALYASPERESFDVVRFKDGRVFERYSRPQRVAFAIVGRVFSFRDVTERERLIGAQSLLVDASRMLASVDLYNALDAVARIAVPCLGESCAIEVFGEEHVMVSHSVDPTKSFTPVWPDQVRHRRSAMYEHDGVSRLAVPILIRDELAGAIAFAAPAQKPHTRPDLEMAERLAQQIALSIENWRLYDRARRALHARDEFLAIAAHELRGPLSAMTLAVQTLRRRGVDESTRERMLALVEREGHRLARFADDVTEITQIRMGTLRFADGPVDLAEVVRESVTRLAPEIARSGSTVTIDAPAPVVGHWDRFRMDQVVDNLLANALKFGLGRPIDVAVHDDDGWSTLAVSDRGLGVPDTHREAIFQPFERAVSVRHYGGLGLGLFIVRTIVGRYGGTVHVEAGHDSEGSRFVVRLPRTEDA